ncbi:MAG TPA: pirin family protein [Candidatus Limnocylindria bacterium]|nr:pirin family protein [Candidatus Limnocylindria bacterium]
MIQIRGSEERGHANHGWLDTRHTFSFADYHDPRFMGFRALRVINEDHVAPARGFGTHPHRDMEILTYMVAGSLQHRDSMGNGSVIKPGEVQRMTAGTGVTHSEMNPSPTEPAHLLQIWILPERPGLPPSYEQREFPAPERRDRLRLVASRDGRDGSVTVHQDVDVYAASLSPGATVELPLQPGRHAWVQVVRGVVAVNGTALADGDGAALSGERSVRLDAHGDAELLLFDLA